LSLPSHAKGTPVPEQEEQPTTVGPVEIALVVCAAERARLLELAGRCRDLMSARLEAALPWFEWRIVLLEVPKPDMGAPVEPVALISDPAIQARARAADFTLILTDRDLAAHYKPCALGAPSRATASAVASICRLAGEMPDQKAREDCLARRLAALCLDLLARLNGLEDSNDPTSFAAPVEEAGDLDRMTRFTEPDRAALRTALRRVADPRVEEQSGGTDSRLRFYLLALWQTRRELLHAIARAEPWLFPLRLSRLTTAALSTLLILVMTAEAWDLAVRQPPWLVAGLSLAALAGTSVFVLARQQLLIHGRQGALTERRVVGNVTTVAVVLLGFLTTYVLLFAVTGGFAALVFDRVLIASWAGATDTEIGGRHYLLMSGFVASLGVVIGALGASFEARSHFRHVAFVDEEI
jgi:hypothetical protein